MTLDWTAEVVGRMHMAAITGKQLADEAGLTNSYLSAVLHNKKGNATTQQRIIDALERLEQRQASEPTVITNTRLWQTPLTVTFKKPTPGRPPRPSNPS